MKSFDEKVIETCKVDEVESEIVEADEFNSRVMEIVRKIIKTTTAIVSTMAGTTSDKNANPGSVQSAGSSIGGQPANVDSENAQVPGSSIPTGIQSSDVLSNNQVENTQQSNFNSHAGIATPQVPPGPVRIFSFLITVTLAETLIQTMSIPWHINRRQNCQSWFFRNSEET